MYKSAWKFAFFLICEYTWEERILYSYWKTMPTTDASNPVTPSVATGAGQASTSQQSSQTADFDFDLDFSDTTPAPVSQTSDVEVPVAESVNAQVSEEVQAPEVASDLDFSLDLPDSYTSSSAENTETTQSVSGDVPVEVSMPEAQEVAPQPDFGSLLNEEREKTSSDLESPKTSEDVHQVVAQEAEDQTFESEASNVPVAQEDASEMEVDAVPESEQHQIFSPDQKEDSEGEKEAFEGEMLTSSMSDEMIPESAESDSRMVSEPIAEAGEESSETLNDGEHEVEFDAEETEGDSLPDYEDEMIDDENLDDDASDETPDLSSEYESFDETPSFEQNDADTLDAESSVDTISDDSLNVEGDASGDAPQQFETQQPEMQNTETSQLSSTFSEEVPVPQSGMFMSQPTEIPVASQESAAQTEESQGVSSVAQGVDLDSMVAAAPVAQAEVSSEFPQTVSENAQSAPTQQESAPQMLSLDEMLSQPAAQVPQQVAPVMDLTSLTVGAQNSSNPLTNPTAYPTVQAAGNDGLMKKVLAGVGGVVLVALAGVMVYIKYPLMFGSGGDTPQQPTTQSGALQPQLALNTSGDQTDHFAAGQEGENTDQNSLVSWGVVSNQATDKTGTEVEVTTPVQEEEVEDVVLGGDEEASPASGENSVSGLNTVSEQQKKTENTTLSGDSAPDALNSVEDLVGPVNSNDVLGQEIELYRQKAQQIADTGRAQNVRMMVKWGTAVAKQVEKIQQELANGGNMTISEWNQKKAELDISLAKATNE